jgi:hypothetical protein
MAYALKPMDKLRKKAISQGPANALLSITLNTIKAIKHIAAIGKAIFVMVRSEMWMVKSQFSMVKDVF